MDQFEAAAKAALATVELIDRTPVGLRDAILRVAGDANRILFASPEDFPAGLFADFAHDPRVVAEPTAEELVTRPLGLPKPSPESPVPALYVSTSATSVQGWRACLRHCTLLLSQPRLVR